MAKLALSFKICLLKNQGASIEEGNEVSVNSLTKIVINGVKDGSIDLESDTISALFAKLIYEDSFDTIDSSDTVKQKFESESDHMIKTSLNL